MDRHTDMVRAAQERARGSPPRLYFAYSTVLDRAAFLEWRDQHGYTEFDLPAGRVGEARDVALVFDFPSRWWGGRVAGLAERPGAGVWGVLFEIAGDAWPIVQHKEGAITGMCVERNVIVRVGGEEVAATAFATNPGRASQEGPVSEAFVEALRSGARTAGLPAAWVESIEAAAR